MLGALIIRGVVLGGVMAWAATASAAPSLFDKPLKQVRLPLPRDPQNPQAKARLTCAYYPHFMVKEIDLGEKGADQLSIVPITGGAQPPCRRENLPSEKIVASEDWNGYFKGVKGDYVFLDADDGWNNGVGFAVVTPDARKIFDDVAKTWRSVELTPSGLTLHYVRVYGAPCSLRADAAGCWRQVRQATGLTAATPPDCVAAYERERKRTPAFAQQVIDDPTVIDYEAAVAIDTTQRKITPVTGKPLGCRPSE